MELIYGVVLSGIYYLNCHANSFKMKFAVFVITSIISFIFGAMAGRGIA